MKFFYSNNNKSLLKKIIEKNQLEVELNEFEDDNVVSEYVLNNKDNNDFTISLGPQSKGIATLDCKICGADSFIVGQAEYFTAIKCKVCQYEIGIHDG